MPFDRYDTLIFDLSSPGRIGTTLPDLTVPEDPSLAKLGHLLRDDLPLPEVAEPEVVRHYVGLSRKNYHVDRGFYPLGSCTMKYNPKVNEDMAGLPGFARLHPNAPDECAQGALLLMHRLGQFLVDLTGMDDVTLQPAAGAHGELTALMMIRACFAERGEDRTEVLTPDSAHGTNLASAAMVGYKVVELKSNPKGRVDLTLLARSLSKKTACVMVTNPNTLGLFEEEIGEIARLTHAVGAYLYMDGANMNALLGRARPGDMGIDVMHLNLHKTFSTPHGGGGPGSGPVLVKKELAPYLPVPRVARIEEPSPSLPGVFRPDTVSRVAALGKKPGREYRLAYDRPKSIGRVHGAYGNFGMYVRAYAYILSLGLEGLTRSSGVAVLNANYLMKRLEKEYGLPFPGRCLHECVLSGSPLKEYEVRTMDVAKRLLDLGFHAPTVYFPLIVEEALMIEPTESESKETLDAFVDAMKQIAREARENPEMLRTSPHSTLVRRLDETRAARQPVLKFQDIGKAEAGKPVGERAAAKPGGCGCG
jgi:glycine dehydrogenase subunit 2